MRITTGIFILLMANSLFAKPLKRGVYEYPNSRFESLNDSIVKSNYDTLKSQDFLREVKFQILNGNLDQAKTLLNKATITSNFTRPIQLRYLSLIYFIEGNYKETLDILNRIEMKDFSTLAKVCIIKVLSYIILDKKKEIKSSWKNCKDAAMNYSPSSLAWMNVLVNMKITKDVDYLDKVFKEIKIENTKEEDLSTILKLSLYLNRQGDVIPRFPYLAISVLKNPIYRELMAFNYYRDNDLVRSYHLLKPLNTANAEVYKGNLLLAQKKFELAYAQFKLALTTKSNSKNAINRLLPLAWKLEQWDDGVDFIQKTEFSKDQTIEAHTLMAAFLTMSGKHNAAKIYLNKIETMTNKSNPIEVSQLKVLNDLKSKNVDGIVENARNSCIKKNGISCWLLIAINSWDSLIEEVGTERSIHTGLKDLTKDLMSAPIDDPLIDEILVEQKYIEELDNNLIKLIN